MIYFTKRANNDLNNIYNYSIYKFKDVLCDSFKQYLADIYRSLEILKQKQNVLFIKNKKEIELINITVNYRLTNDTENKYGIIVTHIKYLGFRRLIQLCAQERSKKVTKGIITRSSKKVSDYTHIPKGKCGEYNGNAIHIVKRKDTDRLNLFNYMLGETTILSPYDFISCGDFFETDGEYKAKAAADRNHWYWIYPTGKIKKIDTKIQKESLDTPVIDSPKKLDSVTIIKKMFEFDFD